jgi:adenylate kinase family enzyme
VLAPSSTLCLVKIAIVGNSGSGKTTLAKSLSEILGIPRIELDQYFHLHNWTHPTSQEFKETVASLIQSHSESGWIIDGNYQRRLDGLVPNSADLIIWFNLKKRVVIYRILKRSIFRSLVRKTLWNGNRESFLNLLKTDPYENIILWSWTQHSRYRDWGIETRNRCLSNQEWFEVKNSSDLKRLKMRLSLMK